MSADELVADVGERWVEVPPVTDAASRDAWVATTSSRVLALGAAWPGGSPDLVPSMLAHALDRRGDDHLVLLHWPAVVPMPVTVRVSVLASPGRAAIAHALRANRAAHPEHVAGARLGPGVEWVHGDALPGAADTGAGVGAAARAEHLIGTQACFADDTTMVLVTLEPTLPDLLPHVIDDVRAVTRSLGRVRGGQDWGALPLPEDAATRADVEAWPSPSETRPGSGANAAAGA
ncbi:hypothetical protein [Agromyces sp. ZXT2-3]|uniref:hypothetical protein n=1 Tax=Agromyces sp. ZXT2-3 TaxID=3461152 RepID=UPI00405515F8